MSERYRDGVSVTLVASAVCVLAGALLVGVGSSFARGSIYGPMLRVVEDPVLLLLFTVASFGAAFTAGWWVVRIRPASRLRTFTSALTGGAAFVLVAAFLLAAGSHALLPADDGTGELLREGGWFGIAFYGAVSTVMVAAVLSAAQPRAATRESS